MKPIVIYLDKHDDEIKLTRKEFEEYINKAYDQGYACGYAEGKKYYPWLNYTGNTIQSTSTMPQPKEVYYGTGTPTPEPGIKITCNTDKNSVFAPGGNITATNSIYPGDNAVEKVVTDSAIPEAVTKILQKLGEEK